MPTITETAASAGSFNTLVNAVKAAGLLEVLSSTGPFTVFAPNDEAFAKVPTETLEGLLKPEAQGQLASILGYHVLPGKVMAADVIRLTSAKTVQGQSLTIDATDGVKVDHATVVAADIECDNGVIHVIDAVMIPN